MTVEDLFKGQLSGNYAYLNVFFFSTKEYCKAYSSPCFTLRYVIDKKEKLATRWVKAGRTTGPECHYKVTDVIEGTEVQFQVRAENEAGVGHPSEPTDILAIEDPTST